MVSTDIITKVTNRTGSVIPQLTAVYLVEWIGGRASIAPCDPNDPTKLPAIGVTRRALGDQSNANIAVQARITFCDTSAWIDGEELYIGSNGLLTNDPSLFDYQQVMGYVKKSDSDIGIVYIGLSGGESVQTTAYTSSVISEQNTLFENILLQLRKLNKHQEQITDIEISDDEIDTN